MLESGLLQIRRTHRLADRRFAVAVGFSEFKAYGFGFGGLGLKFPFQKRP